MSECAKCHGTGKVACSKCGGEKKSSAKSVMVRELFGIVHNVTVQDKKPVVPAMEVGKKSQYAQYVMTEEYVKRAG